MATLDARAALAARVRSRQLNAAAATPFATLQPGNTRSKKLFSEALQYMNAVGDVYHGQFVLESPPPYSPPAAPPNQAQGTNPRPRPLSRLPHHGEFKLYYSNPPEDPLAGWRFGRGIEGRDGIPANLGVDLLPCDPEDDGSIVFQPLEFRLRLYAKSNMLMLERESPHADIAYFVDGQWIQVSAAIVLHMRVNKIRIAGEIEYDLIYDEPRDEFAFGQSEAQRVAYFRDLLRTTPPSFLEWPLPPLPYTSLLHVSRLTEVLGYGTLSTSPGVTWIKGLELVTGMPVLVKEITIGGQPDVRGTVFNEVEILKQIKASKYPKLWNWPLTSQ